MSSSRHYSMDREHLSANNVNNGQSSYSAPSHDSVDNNDLNVEEWLKKAKLSDYHSVFTRESITIEELLSFTDSELLSVANETLHLNVLHRKRFLTAMKETKDKMNKNSNNNSQNIYSLSTSQLQPFTTAIERPLSPTVSVHSAQSSPMGTKYSFNKKNKNNYNPSTKKSPLMTTNYNNHNNYKYNNNYRNNNAMIPSKSLGKMHNYNNHNSNNNNNNNNNNNKRFSKHRKRRHTLPNNENNIYFNGSKGVSKSRPTTPNTTSLSDIESISIESNEFDSPTPHSVHSVQSVQNTNSYNSIKYKNKNKNKLMVNNNRKYKRDKPRRNSNDHSMQRPFKITRFTNHKNKNKKHKKKSKILSSTPTLAPVKPYNIAKQRNLNRNKSMHFILSEHDENDSQNDDDDDDDVDENNIKRMSLNSSDDNMFNNNNNSSNDEMHSADEKWDELNELNELKSDNNGYSTMSIEEKENIHTMNVLLQENTADMNQIENGQKMLNVKFNKCNQEIKEYFDILQTKLNNKQIELLEILLHIKNSKQEQLEKKSIKLNEHKQYILSQKHLCDTIICEMDNKEETKQEREKREIQIATLKDNILNNIHNNENDMIDLNEFDSMIEMDFNVEKRDLFYQNICVIKEYNLPHAPKIKIKHKTNTSITIKIIIMTTKEKKAIQHHPLSNHTKNNKIHKIEIEYIQTKSSNVNQIYTQFNNKNNSHHNNDNLTIKTIAKTNGKSSRKMKRKLKVKNEKKSKRKRRKSRTDIEIIGVKENHNDSKENEMENEFENEIENERQTEVIIMDNNNKIKRIHEITINGLLPKYNCYIRARTQNINGWSEYCEAINTQISKISNELKFDINNSSNGFGINVKYLNENKCILFEKSKEHNMAVLNIIIDKDNYDIFEWQYTIDSASGCEGDICMGFIGYPLIECMSDGTNGKQLGLQGTQYGLFISVNSNLSHVYFTRDNSIHHTCAIKLNKTVQSNDKFKIVCNMKKGKCHIYHNNHLLIDVFNSKIPDKIIPAISACINNGNVKCTVDFISST